LSNGVIEAWFLLTPSWKCLPYLVGKLPSQECIRCHGPLLHNHLCGHPKLVGGIHVENEHQNQNAQLVKDRAFESSFTFEESIVTKF
jgi:hypothetical protein